MLTRDEIEGAHEVLYEQQLEAMDEDELRKLLTDEGALTPFVPPHMEENEARRIAAAKLDQFIARRAAAAQQAAASEASPSAAPPFDWFWAPLRKLFGTESETK